MADAFDVVVIGGGPGGYVAALRAAQLGAKTAIVEKDRMGGTCLVRGCIPTKALLQSSELYTLAKAGQPFGLVADNIRFDWPAAQKRKGQVVDQLVKGVEGLLKAGGITSFKGSARLAGKGVVDVSGEQLQAKDIVIATGSAVARIPLPGAELTIDSDQILELKEVPRRLAVIGGGVVGMEFAAMFAALGSKVTVLEMLPQVLAMVDADLVAVYTKHLARLGGEVHTDSKVSEIAKQNGALQVRFSTGGEGGAVDADQVLVAVGRVPYTQGLGAEEAGVKLERGRVVVDDHLHTSADGVWAIGDVIGGIMLAHVASYEGVCAVENIAGQGNRIPDYRAAPNCIYTDPEIAHVGLGEKEAREKGIEVKVGRFPFAAAGRALTLGQTEGFVKVVADAPTGRVLGVHIVGPRATDLIAEATLAVQNGLTLDQLDLTMHAHPTLPEAIMEAALAAQGRAIHIANRRVQPTATAAVSNPSPTAATLPLHNRERQMVAPVKPTAPPAAAAITAKKLELKKENRDFLLGIHRTMQLIRRFEERAQEQYTKAKIGVFHESLNFSKVFDLPVLWLCVNNRYGMGTPVDKASAVADIYKKACAYDMESIQVDGMNVREVLIKTSEILEKIRADSQPRFIEALCYRFRGHSVVDPDKYRSPEDKEKFRKADPIVFFEHELETSGLADEEYFKNVRAEVETEVQDIIKFADESRDPKVEDLYKYVYAAEWEESPALRGDPFKWLPRKIFTASLCA